MASEAMAPTAIAVPVDRPEWERVARTAAAAVTGGALLGLLTGGIGGRLAMMLLAVTNPAATGVRSDDGFIMGTFTLSGTLNLLLLGALFGIVGAGIYLAVRPWLIGPRALRAATLAGGAGAAVGSLLVHTDGVDFRLLGPVWLAVGLFFAIPALYAAGLPYVVDRLEAGWFAQRGRVAALFPLLAFVFLPLGALVGVPIAVVGLLWSSLRRSDDARKFLTGPVLANAVRGVLVTIFAWGVAGLVRDVSGLV